MLCGLVPSHKLDRKYFNEERNSKSNTNNALKTYKLAREILILKFQLLCHSSLFKYLFNNNV